MREIFRNSYFINIIIFRIGYLIYMITGKTLYLSYRSMINLYCITNGDFLNKLNLSKSLQIEILGKAVFLKILIKQKLNLFQMIYVTRVMQYLSKNWTLIQ